MINYRIDIRFEGTKFYPSALEPLINTKLKILAETGKPALKGRFIGQPSPYGMALLQIPVLENDMQNTLDKYIFKLESWEQSLKNCGIDEITIDIGYTEESPVNIKISNEQMHKLGSLNTLIEFYSISKEERFEHSSKKIKNILGRYNKQNDYNTILLNLQKHQNFLVNDTALSTVLYFMLSGDSTKSIEENINNIEQLNKISEEDFEYQ